MRRLSIFNLTSLALGLAFLYLPIAVLVVYSFNASRLNVRWTGFTVDWYRRLFENTEILAAFQNSLVIAGVTTVFMIVSSMPSFSRGRVRRRTCALRDYDPSCLF